MDFDVKIDCCTKIITANGYQIICPNVKINYVEERMAEGAPFNISAVVVADEWSNIMEEGVVDPNHIVMAYEIDAKRTLLLKLKNKVEIVAQYNIDNNCL